MKLSSHVAVPGFLPSALASSDVGVWDYDPATGLTYGDETFARILGLPAEETVSGVSGERFFACVHAEDRDRIGQKRRQLLAHGGAFINEYRTMPSPGDVRRVLVRGRYEVDGGRPLRGGGIVVDITDTTIDGRDGRPFQLDTEVVFYDETALEKAARLAIATRRAIDEVNQDVRQRLIPTINTLLADLARLLIRASRNKKIN